MSAAQVFALEVFEIDLTCEAAFWILIQTYKRKYSIIGFFKLVVTVRLTVVTNVNKELGTVEKQISNF